MIELGIVSSIGNGMSTYVNVGCDSKSPTETLVPGNVVALYLYGSGFIGIEESASSNQVKCSGSSYFEGLPMTFASGRFLVVDAGKGQVAFFNPGSRRFLSCDASGHPSAAGYSVSSLHDHPRGNECFQVQEITGGKCNLYCAMEKKTLMEQQYSCSIDIFVVSIHGFS